MFRLTVIPEIGNSAASKPSYVSIDAAIADGKRLAAVIFGSAEIGRVGDESMEAYITTRVAALMCGDPAPSQEPKILEMFSVTELEGLMGFGQPSVRVVVTDAINQKHHDQKFVKSDFHR